MARNVQERRYDAASDENLQPRRRSPFGVSLWQVELTVKAYELVAVPFGVVTETVPVVADAGTVA